MSAIKIIRATHEHDRKCRKVIYFALMAHHLFRYKQVAQALPVIGP